MHGVREQAVDQLDDGRVIDLRLERRDADVLVPVLEQLDVVVAPRSTRAAG
jgi:hypothetical protein